MAGSTTGDQFAQVPWRVTDALRRGELTRDEYVTLQYLISTISHELWTRPISERVLVTELAVIKAETSWTKSVERLRQIVESLVAKNWIETATESGNRKWRIRATGASVFGSGDEVTENGRQNLELSSKRARNIGGRKPRADAPLRSVEAPSDNASLDVDIDVDQSLVTKGGRFEEDRLADDVAPYVRKGRALRCAEALERRPGRIADELREALADIDDPSDQAFIKSTIAGFE